MTYWKELPLKNSPDPSSGGHVRSRDKLSKLYLHLQNTRGHQTKQGADLQWEAPILKFKWLFDHVTNVMSLDNLKILYFHYRKTYNQ